MERIGDLEEANRCIRELVAISLLPCIWSGGQPEKIRTNLADALVSSLRADMVSVWCEGNSHLDEGQVFRTHLGGSRDELRQELSSAIGKAVMRGSDDVVEIIVGGCAFKVAILQLGLGHEFGMLAVGSARGNFPTPMERVLLNVAVNQATVALRGAQQLTTLRRSESDLRDFFENATVGLHWVDENGIIVWANQTELDMLGYGKEEYLGHSITEFHTEGCVIEDILARLKRGEKLHEYEATLRCKDGTTRTVLIDSSVLFEESKFVHTRCFTRDITGRKMAERSAAEASEQMRLALETAEVGSWEYRFEEGMIYWDSRCRAMWGVAEGEGLRHEEVMQRVHPEDRESVATAVQSALTAEKNGMYEVDFRVVWPGGNIRWIASRGQVYSRTGDRTPARFVGITRDFTKEKEAQEAIEASEKQLRALADSIPQLAWIAEPDGSRSWFNRRWFEYTGTTLEQVKGWGWQSVHDQSRIATLMEHWKGFIAKGKPFQTDFPLRAADGSYRWFLTQVNPVYNSQNRVIRWFGTNTDVEELKRAQDALREAQEKLRDHAEKLEEQVAERTVRLRETIQELEAFSYSISHDLRAPARAMQGYSEALLQEYSGTLDPTGREYLMRIQRSAKRMDMLIQDVLAYTKVAKGEISLGPVDAAAVVRDVILNYPALYPDQAEINIETAIPPVFGHEAYLTQIFSNLLTNAAKFVSLGVKPRISISATEDGGMVRIAIRDNGVGIAAEHQREIFTIFGRVYSDKEYEGTGIGLPIAKKAAERLGGSIEVKSALGQGSTFIVILPRADRVGNIGKVERSVNDIAMVEPRPFIVAEHQELSSAERP